MDPKVMALDTETTTPAPTTTTTTASSSETASDGTNSTVEVNAEDKLPANLTQIDADATLKDSKLAAINVNDTSEADITAAFCREVGTISGRYEVRGKT